MTEKISMVIFRQDLRLSDNPALTAARKFSDKIIPVYIYDEQDPWQPGGAQQWWLHHSLTALQADVEKLGGKLLLKRGDYQLLLLKLIKETKAQAVFWNRCYEPYAIKRDQKVKLALKELSVSVESFQANLLNEPWSIMNKQGGFFKVYTPYWRAAQQHIEEVLPLSRVATLTTPATVKSDNLKSWSLLPTKPDWAKQFGQFWQPGEKGAQQRLNKFLKNNLNDYVKDRDFPIQDITSNLSPHLHFGEMSPRQVWHQAQQYAVQHKVSQKSLEKFLAQLGWREFSYYLLYHFPKLPMQNFNAKFDKFKWQKNKKLLTAWQQGKTGYPIVDAGMRELWQTGTMHNRVRMIVASFLVKDLLIDWREGAKWFWDTLVDADLANNSASWQWVAGSGADAAPYFRIFNPTLQAEKFDPHGEYIKKWLPEQTHDPIVDHGEARKEALALYQQIR